MLNRIVIIAAGGTGSRIKSTLPKQYMLLAGIPVLLHTLAKFSPLVDKIVVVLHADMATLWDGYIKEYAITIPHDIVIGGNSRFQSVKNGLAYLQKQYQTQLTAATVIAVHDAARPLVDAKLIDLSLQEAAKGQCNTLATKSTNSIRIGTASQSKAVDRNSVWQVQTPQSFPAELLFNAYQQPESPLFTDDASVVETCGYTIKLIEGSATNIKITYPQDFEMAEQLLNNP
ncbi:2-C-methyl-D-erythritol 4-phosphate cytidylyltransferase [Sphingobacterium sp. Mn56C]